MIPLRPLLALAAPCLLPVLVTGQTAAPDQLSVIESDGQGVMVSTDKETTFTFRDNVRFTGTDIKLNCDYLKVVVNRTGDPKATIGKVEKFQSLLATGHVRILQQDREAACGRAEVLPTEDKIVLTETPVIVLHNPEFRGAGKTITMLRAQRQVLIDEPILTGPPVKDLGVDKSKTGEATPAAATPKQP
jgi:lipopolysaccharide export system protein LptA